MLGVVFIRRLALETLAALLGIRCLYSWAYVCVCVCVCVYVCMYTSMSRPTKVHGRTCQSNSRVDIPG